MMERMPKPEIMRRDWREGMTPREYKQAKAARAEMLGHLSQRGLGMKANVKPKAVRAVSSPVVAAQVN